MAEAPEARRPLPTGTVTFLRTDVEGSMRLARDLGPTWDAINALHLGILREAVDRHGGVCVRTEGDAMFAAFPEAGAAVLAAIDGQRALLTHEWPEDGAVRVRMGVHTGEAHLAGDDYGGFDVNRAARIAAVGHGGQIILSGTTHGLVVSNLSPDLAFRKLGRHVLRDVPTPEHLFQVDVPGERTDFPPLRVPDASAGNLPERLTSFVGRSEELDELRPLLEESRLVTLTGPGGIGKTSLAIELARDRAATMPDGAWFVALEAVTDPAVVGTTIARSLGLFDGIDRPAAEALPGFLAMRSLVLVLDNFEQVLDAAGEVSTLLRVSPGSRIVVTSRAPLHVTGEQEYPVRPLPVGGTSGGIAGPTAASIHLFTDRARAVQPGWEPGPDVPLVTEICGLLDGLPLGIELAAARISLLPVRAIRDRLASRLPLPGSGPRDAPARQRTLDGAIEWSHELLQPDDQRTLHELGVFEGTFDTEQAERVVAPDTSGSGDDVLDRLITLAEQSLISRDLAAVGDDARLAASGVRFGMLRTVQVFAAARLVADGRDAEVRDRHARAYLELAEVAARHLNTGGQPPWLDRLIRDDANIQSAFRWAIETGDTDTALRLLGALWRYWLLEGRLGEGSQWVHAVFAMPGADRSTAVRVRALSAAGGIAYWRSDQEASQRLYQEQLDVATHIEDAPGIADAYINLASSTFVGGNMSKAGELTLEARRLYAELGDEVNLNRIDWGLTTMRVRRGELEEAIVDLQRVLERAEALDDAPYVAMAAGNIAWTRFLQGDMASAGRWAIRSMLGYYASRDRAASTISLPIGAILALEAGRPHDAAVILGAFEALAERYGVRPPVGLAEMIKTVDPLERARAALSPDELTKALEQGSRMTLDEAMEMITHAVDGAGAA